MMVIIHSAHAERKQETIVKISLENWGTNKKNNTQSAQSAQSARSAESAVCSLHGLRFNMTGVILSYHRIIVPHLNDKWFFFHELYHLKLLWF